MIKDIVSQSRSYRTFDESRTVTKDELLSLVDTARLCPSAMNRQPLKYKLVFEREETEDLLSLTKWGGSLPDLKLPPDGKHPTAFITVCCDTAICENIDSARFDAGVASQTILLSATEIGLGGCILGAFDKDTVAAKLHLSDTLKPIVIIALGKPAENVFICNMPDSGSTAYYRDKANNHFVPKRALEDIIIK